MSTKTKTVARWPLVVIYLSIVLVLGACANNSDRTETPIPTETAILRLQDGAIQVPEGDNGWVPVGGETTFELAGEVESIDPWMVTGNTFAVRDLTQIDEGLESGDLVKVKGMILADGTWLAGSIERADEQTDPTITLLSKVDTVDPWVVHGITLDVTDDTEISGEIVPGMIVAVDILLQRDGTWDVIGITPLSDFIEIPGCTTVTATVVRVDGDDVQFAGWPVITLGEQIHIEEETGQEATLHADQRVLIVVCAAEDGQFTMTKIIVLQAGAGNGNGEKVLICHKPDQKGGHTLSVAAPAVSAHLAHGDKLGQCP